MLAILGVGRWKQKDSWSSRPTRLGSGPIRDDFPKETGPQGTTLKIVLWSPQAHVRAVPHTYTVTTPPPPQRTHQHAQAHVASCCCVWNRNDDELHVSPIR